MNLGNTRILKRFNLIELILVITVLIGLGSLLLPLVYQAITRAQGASCADNLKTLGTWVTNYTSSYKGLLPAYEDGWVAEIAKAGGKTVDQNKLPEGVFACPSQKEVSYGPGISPSAWWRGSHYGINQHLASRMLDADGRVTRHWTRANVRDIREPSLKALMADATGGNIFGIPGRDPVVAGISFDGRTYADCLPPTPTIGMPYMRHVDATGNFLFLDSHVDTLTTWPSYMLGRGTRGFEFWHGEHWFKELMARAAAAKEKQTKAAGAKSTKKTGTAKRP